jgi:N-acetylglutamate synthase-like GNAT family acetyltransferase
MVNFAIRTLNETDHVWVRELLTSYWGSPTVVVHDSVYHPEHLPGFVAVDGERRLGLLTYRKEGCECELVTLNSLVPDTGVGTALVAAARDAARQAGCTRLWLMTTNDNLRALGFFQKRGYRLVKVYRDAVTRARLKKPEIPSMAEGGIPIRDEIELEFIITEGGHSDAEAAATDRRTEAKK